MTKYIYRIKTPSEKRKKEIQDGLHELAKKLSCVEFVQALSQITIAVSRIIV